MENHPALKRRPVPADVAGEAEEVSNVVQKLLNVVPAAPRQAEEARRTAVLWVYRDYGDRWCVREEGGKFEAAFGSREKAAACARAAGHAAGSYRLFLQLKDGRVTEEHFNLANRPAAANGKLRLPFIH